jgi:hypothetical protein
MSAAPARVTIAAPLASRNQDKLSRLHRNYTGTDFVIMLLKEWRAINTFSFNILDGAQGRNRTTDTAIFSRMLYQLSYLGAAGI